MRKKLLAVFLLIIISLVSIPYMTVTASSGYYLEASDYSNILQKGSKKKIVLGAYVKGEKALKWWTSSKKLKITKRKKSYCVVKGMKTGKCYVKAIMKDLYGKKHRVKIKIKIKPRSKVTYNNYTYISTGMTYDQVKQLLGNPRDHSVYEYDDYEWSDYYDDLVRVHIREDSYTWKNPYSYAYIYVDFTNGYVTNCSYSG